MTDKLNQLANAWKKAKLVEAGAIKARIDIENKIIAITGAKEEGSKTHPAGELKITVTGKINRSLDVVAWDAIAPKVPEQLRPVKYKPEIDIKGLRYLESNEPKIYKLVAQAIVAKPGKTAVEIK